MCYKKFSMFSLFSCIFIETHWLHTGEQNFCMQRVPRSFLSRNNYTLGKFYWLFSSCRGLLVKGEVFCYVQAVKRPITYIENTLFFRWKSAQAAGQSTHQSQLVYRYLQIPFQLPELYSCPVNVYRPRFLYRLQSLLLYRVKWLLFRSKSIRQSYT